MYNYFFIIIVSLVVIDFLFGQYLSFLNKKHASAQLPDEVANIYNKEEYARQQNYFIANLKFSTVSHTFSFIVILLFLFLFGFAGIEGISTSIFEHEIPVSLLFFAIIGLGSSVLGLPFDWYDTFVLEEKFGFNKTTRKTFWLDFVKGLFLSALIGIPLLSLIIWIYLKTGDCFWILAWGVTGLFSVVMNMFYSEWIVPLFNKQTPLEEGELRNAIEDFAGKAGFKLDNIFLIDGSKRSTKANAYFAGLGKKKRIVLFDTLIQELTTDEIVAVLAHEIGHYKKKHTLQSLVFSLINAGIMFFVLSLFLGNVDLSLALGSDTPDTPSFRLSLIGFGLLYAPVSLLIGIFMNIISRKNEYQADDYAASFGLGKTLGEGLKKLSVKSLSNLTPHPLYVFFHYSHPTLLQRLNRLNQNTNIK